MHERIKESLLLGGRTKRNLAWCFEQFLQSFDRELSVKNHLF